MFCTCTIFYTCTILLLYFFQLRALSHVLKCKIEVIQATGPPVILGEEYKNNRHIILTYHRHMYGLGEHYNSVQPYCEEENGTDNIS